MYPSSLPIAVLGACLAVLSSCQIANAASPPNPATAPAAPAPTSTPVGTAAAPPAVLPPLTPPMAAAQVIQVLDQAVDWYRTLGTQQQAANEPSDLLFLYDNRQTAAKVMGLAFDIARADADMLAKAPAATPD